MKRAHSIPRDDKHPRAAKRRMRTKLATDDIVCLHEQSVCRQKLILWREGAPVTRYLAVAIGPGNTGVHIGPEWSDHDAVAGERELVGCKALNAILEW